MKRIHVLLIVILALLFLVSCKEAQEQKEYNIIEYTSTGLPLVTMETEKHQSIVSKNEWINCNFSVKDAEGELLYENVAAAKRRGNSTLVTKGSYTVKLDSKISILDMPKHKRWVVVSNWYDRSFLRNRLVSKMGTELFTNLDWTPSFQNVDLILNGEYFGSYILGEQIRIDKNRVNIDKENKGFIVEIDVRKHEDYNFETTKGLCFSLKDYDDDTYTDLNEFGDYAKQIIQNCEDVLFSEDFETKYETVIDVDSFVDWLVINEIVKNMDSRDFSSIYLYYNPDDGLVHYGPLWDYDLAFGNYDTPNAKPEGLYISKCCWYSRLLQIPAFKQKVAERFFEVKDDVSAMISDWIPKEADKIRVSAEQNFRIWDVLGKRLGPDDCAMGAGEGFENRLTYQSEVDFLSEWRTARLDWLSNEFGTWL